MKVRRVFWLVSFLSQTRRTRFVVVAILWLVGCGVAVSHGDEKPTVALRPRPSAAVLDAMRALRHQRILQQTTEMEFLNTPLREVVEFIQLKHKFRIELDRIALQGAIVDLDMPIDFMAQDVTLRAALDRMLEKYFLTHLWQGDVLQITSLKKMRRMTFIKMYTLTKPESDRAERDDLIQLAKLAIDDDPYLGLQDPNTEKVKTYVAAVGDVLCVRATVTGLRRFDAVLEQMSVNSRSPVGMSQHPLAAWKFGSELDLSEVMLSNEDFQELRPTVPLETLILPKGGVYGRDFAEPFDAHWLEQHPNLTTLIGSLSDKHLESIVKLKKLKYLTTFNSAITDRGLAKLAECTALEVLYISNDRDIYIARQNRQRKEKGEELRPFKQQLTQAGLDQLAKQLPKCMIDARIPESPKGE